MEKIGMRRSKQEIWDDKLSKVHDIVSEVSLQMEQILGQDSHVAAKVGNIMCEIDECRAELETEIEERMSE
jgi:hypothetical protein